MAHEQQRAGPVHELRFEQLQRLEVEVVGRFVEHQHVGRTREEPRQQQAVAFAARQRLHRRARAIGRKQEVFEIAVHVARAPGNRDAVVAVAHGIDHRALGVELLALLVVVGHLHVGAVANRA